MTLRTLLLACLAALATVCAPAQAPDREGETLVLPDRATTQSLELEMAQVASRLETLRALSERAVYDENPEPASDAMLASFRRACGQVAVLRPDSKERAGMLAARTATLLRYFEQDYAAGNRPGVANTVRILGATAGALSSEATAAIHAGAPSQSDVATGDATWVPAGFEDAAYRASLRGLSTRSILGEFAVHRGALARAVTRDEMLTACTRISEAGRELSTRAESLSDSSRKPFRNTALRADVIGESIYLYALRGDAERRSRQERLLRDVEGELAAFLDVNGM